MFGLPSINTLLTLPFLSIFLLPSAFTSYTTSLNLLFFYLTWSTVVLSHPPVAVEFFGTLSVRVLFYVLPSLAFLVFDLGIPSLSNSIKEYGDSAHPVRALKTKKAPHVAFSYVVGISLVNIVLATAVQTSVDYLFASVLHVRSALRIATTLPLPWSLAKDLSRAIVIRNVSSYFIHRFLLHSREYSPVLTRWHKTYHHSFKTCVPLSTSYDHPAVYLLFRFLPTYLPALLFRMHLLTYCLLLALTGLEEALAYSGYSVLPSAVLLYGMARRQDMHMRTGGQGNYGPWGLLDWVFGTTLAGRDFIDDVRTEGVKRDVSGKAGRMAGRVEKGARDLVNGDSEDEEEEDRQEPEQSGSGSGNGGSRKSKRSRKGQKA